MDSAGEPGMHSAPGAGNETPHGAPACGGLPLPTTPGRELHWGGLCDLGLALAVAETAQRVTHAPLLLVLPEVEAVERVYTELEFFLGARRATTPLWVFPDWETLPYDACSPHADIVSSRLELLDALPRLRRGIVLVAAGTLAHRLPHAQYIEARGFELRRGANLDPRDFRRRLERGGYRFVSQVREHGEVAIRGSLIDLFPMGAARPCRIDLDDERIDSLRPFDQDSQRSTGCIDCLRLLPAREYPLDEEAVERFRSAWREAFPGDPRRVNIYREVSAGRGPPGIEYYLPLFFESTALLFDYLPRNTIVLTHEDADRATADFLEKAKERSEAKHTAREQPVLPPERIFASLEELQRRRATHPGIRLWESSARKAHGLQSGMPPPVALNAQANPPSQHLQAFLKKFPGRVLLTAGSPGRRETLLELLRGAGLRPVECADWPAFLASEARLGVAPAPLERALFLHDPALALFGEVQVFGDLKRRRRARRRAADLEELIQNLSELRTGSAVVHREHGVGRYRGLVTLTPENYPEEFLQLEYAGGDLLYVPIAALNAVSRYTGLDPEHAPLHRLGGDQWERARRKAATRIRDTAAELLELQAQRTAGGGAAFRVDEEAYRSFAASFPFDETEDQGRAIQEVLEDLRATTPMDRLVCGDSGFGKTEVALRAAFVAVDNGCQVVLLVPTTLLAQQHYRSFLERFADWPVRVEALSRFEQRGPQRAVLDGLADGTVDIVIGTHKLLRADLKIKRLGLVIIDEEHRFGVHQKERLKKLRAKVNLLALTATPIPRTLNLSLAGLRSLSLISTPPARRLPVKTFICEWSDTLLREAMLREINRGGQVFFIHNRVETIARSLEELRRLLPEANIALAHGKLPKRELERVMLDFRAGRCHVLLCTTIVETGLDIPNANTIIIDQAQRLGLAQIYQLRGRVGRSHHNAYAYLVAPSRQAMSETAQARLRAVAQLNELGVGFNLAGHDLEIRGAGELLGEEQSGHVQELGFGAYMELLQQAVRDLRSGAARYPEQAAPEVELNFHLPALFPEDYIPDLHERLLLYRRLATLTDAAPLAALREEVIDRFGRLPQAARDLFRLAELKAPARAAGILHVEFRERGGSLRFHEHSPVPPARVLELVQGGHGAYRFQEGKVLRIAGPIQASERIPLAARLIQQLNG